MYMYFLKQDGLTHLHHISAFIKGKTLEKMLTRSICVLEECHHYIFPTQFYLISVHLVHVYDPRTELTPVGSNIPVNVVTKRTSSSGSFTFGSICVIS